MLEIWELTIFQRSYERNAVFNTTFILWITHCHAWIMSRLRGFCCPLSKWLSLWANIAKSKDLTTSVGLRPKWIWVLQKLYPITSYPITYIQELSQVNLLSPSGDLGISLVWHNLSPPDRTGPHRLFGPTVEILFKLN